MKRSNLNNIMLNTYRHDVIRLLKSNKDNIGVELGVATGVFSLRMVESGYFSSFFGVDMYADMHNVDEYKEALKKVGLHGKYKLLRMTFDEAYDLFKDESLDFIYIDANHTYESAKEDIQLWYPKIKVGGMISGHDYIPNRLYKGKEEKNIPILLDKDKNEGHYYAGMFGVNHAVNEFVDKYNYKLNVTDEFLGTWWVIKK